MLVLASKSAVRRALLAGAGLTFEARAADVNEREIESRFHGESPLVIARRLAEAKALGIDSAVVIGADQILSHAGRLLHKPQTLGGARVQLLALRGTSHELHAGVALAVNGRIAWSEVKSARLTMRDFSGAELDHVLEQEGEAVLASVGGYRLEGPSIRLFEAIEGDYFTILGLPLLPLLAALRAHAPQVLGGFHVKRAFVLGHPIAHSRSPLIHGHWLEQYGIPGSYEPVDVAPDALPAFLDRIRAGEFVGGNVTVPLKQLAFDLVDTHDLDTVHLGATNTITTYASSDGITLHGTNTDHYGFLANLDAAVPGWSESQRKAIVLGAGGAARAVAAALSLRVCRTYILNRTPGRAKTMARELSGGTRMQPRGLDAWRRLAPSTRIVVNTTTVGMHGTAFDDLPLELLPRDALVTDIVYVPLVTPFLAEAQRLGLRTVDGLGMLLHQAVPGFEAWFGVRPEVTPELRGKIEATLR